MERACRFRPAVDALEGRVVLSFSFAKMFHSVFPFIPDKGSKTVVKAHPHRAISASAHHPAHPAATPHHGSTGPAHPRGALHLAARAATSH